MAAGPSVSPSRDLLAPARTPGFRPELHELRGVAIGLVVVYHVWLDRVSGGVDVFLFLSAFLLTGTFLRVADRDGRPRPIACWARMFKRLLPPASVVVLASLVGVFTLLGADRWLPSLTDAAASLLQLQNWVQIQRGTDYYAADASTASVFHHFWSLSIQAQVFLVWPVLISVVILMARAVGVPVRGALTVVFTVVTATSLAWSVHSTGTQQTVAYFDTLARVWEFSAGSLMSLALMPRAAALGRNGTGPGGSTAVPAPGVGAACGGGAPAHGRRRADRPRGCASTVIARPPHPPGGGRLGGTGGLSLLRDAGGRARRVPRLDRSVAALCSSAGAAGRLHRTPAQRGPSAVRTACASMPPCCPTVRPLRIPRRCRDRAAGPELAGVPAAGVPARGGEGDGVHRCRPHLRHLRGVDAGGGGQAAH